MLFLVCDPTWGEEGDQNRNQTGGRANQAGYSSLLNPYTSKVMIFRIFRIFFCRRNFSSSPLLTHLVRAYFPISPQIFVFALPSLPLPLFGWVITKLWDSGVLATTIYKLLNFLFSSLFNCSLIFESGETPIIFTFFGIYLQLFDGGRQYYAEAFFLIRTAFPRRTPVLHNTANDFFQELDERAPMLTGTHNTFIFYY